METKGYVIGILSGQKHFRLNDVILRQQNQWDDTMDFACCPNHNISYPIATSCSEEIRYDL